jgi:hypothetical protein
VRGFFRFWVPKMNIKIDKFRPLKSLIITEIRLFSEKANASWFFDELHSVQRDFKLIQNLVEVTAERKIRKMKVVEGINLILKSGEKIFCPKEQIFCNKDLSLKEIIKFMNEEIRNQVTNHFGV